jgi:cell division transport system permease protein
MSTTPDKKRGAVAASRSAASAAQPTRSASSGASAQSIGFVHRATAWLAHNQLVAVETLLTLLARPASSLLTWLVVAIALTLPGALWMSLTNIEQLSGNFQQSGRITLYLQQEASVAAGQTLLQRIEGLEDVVDTEYISAEQALAQFSAASGLADALAMLSENPLPAVILVEPPLGLTAERLQQLLQQLTSFHIVDSAQLDMAWLERLRAIIALGERLIWVLGVMLALAILLVVGNTIRLSIAARVDEIRVIKLVGGTDAYVRRPFLYTGLWYGMVGGLLAWLMLIGCWLLLKQPVAELSALYGSAFELQPLSANAALVLLSGAMLLGWLGAWWSVSRHLHEIEP